MRRKLGLVLGLSLLAIPSFVSAKTLSTGTPGFDASGKVFEAKGTPIEIKEVNGKTIITWEGETTGVEISANTVIVGGYYNPCSGETDACTIDLPSTSITVNSGNVGEITGGNLVTDFKNATYDKIHVSDVKVNVNGGTVSGITAVTQATYIGADRYDVAIPTKYVSTNGVVTYDAMKAYYYVDKATINVTNATVRNRIIGTTSYSALKDFVINIKNSTVKHESSTNVGIGAGANGYVTNFTVNVTDSNIDRIVSGQRVMVEKMNVTVDGKTTVGDLYAGSFYDKSEQSGASWWEKIGNVNYGQVKEINFKLGKKVTYGNIYAGFQFVEKAKFLEVNKGNAALEGYAKGFDNSENALVSITIANAPKNVNSGLKSMLDPDLKNVTVTYLRNEVEAPVVDPSKDVADTTVGITDKGQVNKVLEEEVKNNEAVLDAVNKGIDVDIAIKMDKVEASSDTKTKMEELANTKGENTKVSSYFDINVLLKNKATNEEISKIKNLNNALELTVLLSNDLRTVSEGYTRNYYVIREHDGKVEFIDATLSQDGKLLSFKTDKFSVYAIAYNDTKNEEPSKPSIPENPKTGDNIALYATIGAASILVVAGLIKFREQLI